MERPYKKRPKHIVSYTMSRIRSKGTGIEVNLEKILRLSGIKFRRQYNITGKPDFVILDYKIAIFCDSDFWHGYDWEKRKPRMRANKEYWIPKIERNISRDKEVTAALRREGWVVLRFWEHSIYKDINICAEKIIRTMEKRQDQ